LLSAQRSIPVDGFIENLHDLFAAQYGDARARLIRGVSAACAEADDGN